MEKPPSQQYPKVLLLHSSSRSASHAFREISRSMEHISRSNQFLPVFTGEYSTIIQTALPADNFLHDIQQRPLIQFFSAPFPVQSDNSSGGPRSAERSFPFRSPDILYPISAGRYRECSFLQCQSF